LNRFIILKRTLKKFTSAPVNYICLVFSKIFIYPKRYKLGQNDYDAESYWKDRFVRYGQDVRGPGDEGDSVKNNIVRYERVKKVVKNILESNISNFSNYKVLEIGVGTGIITDTLNKLGIKDYLGVDITNVLFEDLRNNFSNYEFKRLDITTELIEGKYDLIVIIDVIEHIVTDEKFNFAITNIKNALSEHGYILIAPIVDKNYKAQFYERHWTINDIKFILVNCEYSDPVKWEDDSYLYVVHNL